MAHSGQYITSGSTALPWPQMPVVGSVNNGSPVLPLQLRKDVFWIIYWLHFNTQLFAIYNFMKYKVSPPPSLMTLGSEPMPIPLIVNISPWLLTFERTYVICLKDCKVSQARKPLLNSPVLLLTFLNWKFIRTSYINHVKILYSCNPPHTNSDLWKTFQRYLDTIMLEIICYCITNDYTL
jgi:hypothetical protein